MDQVLWKKESGARKGSKFVLIETTNRGFVLLHFIKNQITVFLVYYL